MAGLSKRFSPPVQGRRRRNLETPGHLALDQVSLEVKRGEFVTIIGPSGSGKSTLLNCIAGMERYHGTVTVDETLVTSPLEGVAMVFQSPHLLPWRTAFGNVEYGMELQGVGSDERRERAEQVLELVGLADSAHRFPSQLSGGMQQRTNIARALAVRPGLLLMDEPFGALDAITKEYLQEELLGIVAREQVTTIFVTHDISEAIFLGDRVVVLQSNPGRVMREEAIGSPRPRHLEWKRSAEFQQHFETLWEALAGAGRQV